MPTNLTKFSKLNLKMYYIKLNDNYKFIENKSLIRKN